jgi:hypothetical protein
MMAKNGWLIITTMKDFRQLKVWEKAHQLALAVYKVTKGFPKEAHEKLHMDVEEVKRMPAFLLKTLRAGR